MVLFMPIALGKGNDEKYCFLHLGALHRDLLQMESFRVYYLKPVFQILNTADTRHSLSFICHKIKYSCVCHRFWPKEKKNKRKTTMMSWSLKAEVILRINIQTD